MLPVFHVIALASALFVAIILSVAVKPRFSRRFTGICSVVTAVSGLLLYGYGYTAVLKNVFLAAVRTLLSVCGMYLTSEDFSEISDAPFFQNPWGQLLFWAVHFLAFYVSASTALSTLGAGPLRKIRLWLSRKSDLYVIRGLREETLDFGKELLARENCTVVFIDADAESDFSLSIASMGCVRRFDDNALNANRKFLRSIGLRQGKRKVTLCALGTDDNDNLRYAQQFLKSLEDAGISPEQTSLVIHCREEDAAAAMQVGNNHYGYGFVTVYQEADLAARLLVHKYPPCRSLSFTADGEATEDFHALILGFGRLGQAVLKKLVMNGQFAGNHFRADVFAPNCQSVNGYFTNGLTQVLQHYTICFHPYDGRSAQMYDYLSRQSSKLKYVALCTGSDKLNQEIAMELQDYFQYLKIQVPIFQCSYRGIKTADGNLHKLYHPDVLALNTLDEMAMVLNHYYQGENGTTPVNDWMHCDYFSRMSSRASADYLQAMLLAAGKTEEQVLNGQWSFSETHLENLGIMEHRRWCAFHYCMGFAPMSDAEFQQRADMFTQQKQAGLPTIRIAKNMAGKTHACLVDWTQLDALSGKEFAITGKNANYKALDIENVLAVPELLKIRREAQQKQAQSK